MLFYLEERQGARYFFLVSELLNTFVIISHAGSYSDGIVDISRAPKYLYGSMIPDFCAAFCLLIVLSSSYGSCQSTSD